MSSKSKHRRKHSSQSQRRKSGQKLSSSVTQQISTQLLESVTSPNATVPPASTFNQAPNLTTTRYTYVLTELRVIGILAGIILAILVVLALFLP